MVAGTNDMSHDDGNYNDDLANPEDELYSIRQQIIMTVVGTASAAGSRSR